MNKIFERTDWLNEEQIYNEIEENRKKENYENVIKVCRKCKSEIHLTKEESNEVGLRCPSCKKLI